MIILDPVFFAFFAGPSKEMSYCLMVNSWKSRSPHVKEEQDTADTLR